MALLAAIVGLMWLIEAINALTTGGHGLDDEGAIYARSIGHLWAIFTAPFLHVGWAHLIDNTIPLVFMGVFVALRGAARLALVTLIVMLIGGFGTWLIAPSGTETVGASGIVFGYATYLLTRGVFDRSWVEILIGLVVGVVWGGALLSSLVPQHGISWQGHACGAIGGVVAAWLLGAHRARAGRGTPSGTPPGAEALGGRTHGDALDRALAQ
ncbi:MAG: rhomboid family intramembrane serine protease [Solirubrobacterales bacterium]|nr:rhomboid family intramembrane serine protease [Solirubrobacterales bacterium]